MKGIDFQIKHHESFLKARNIDRVVQSDFFCAAWDDASVKRQEEAVSLIEKLNVRELNSWLFGDFEGCSVRELRKIASANHVHNYCDMDKAELIHHFITEGIKNVKDRGTSGNNASDLIGSGSERAANKCEVR